MERTRKNTMPKTEEDYKVNYVFKENSKVDVNDVIKECFVVYVNKQRV